VSAPPPHLYRREALALGRDPATVDSAIAIANTVRAHGAYPVYTLNHLAELTGGPWRYLRDVVARRRDPYLDIERPKADGRTRAISSPEPVLMDVQRWILRNVLCACHMHSASYAYRRRRSIMDCARMHLGARWLMKLDIHNFFDTVTERRVYRTFAGIGYPSLLSLELTRLCTRAGPIDLIRRDHASYRDKAPYSVRNEGYLPQGAPTSGALANAAMFRVDVDLAEFANKHGLVYTRYSDDLTFSAGPDFSRARAAAVVNRVAAILRTHGFALHRAKTRIVPPGARHVILGLLVDHDRVRLQPEYKRRIEVHVRGVATFGLTEHARHRRFESVLSMINHVDGSIAFAASVEPTFADGLRERWQEALRDGGFAVPPKP
jgi:RNA-directed DNA polymerase